MLDLAWQSNRTIDEVIRTRSVMRDDARGD